VAGGSSRLAAIVDTPPSIARCTEQVTSIDMGGLVTFTGVVRRHNRGQDVQELTYEAYTDMAEKVMGELCQEIENEFPGARLAVEHRVGTLVVGDIAVVIAAAAPHRQEAFAACRAMIDRLKDRVPIWKKERTADGSEWIGLGP
jgi:molybdopterin synthase catalytic subunit